MFEPPNFLAEFAAGVFLSFVWGGGGGEIPRKILHARLFDSVKVYAPHIRTGGGALQTRFDVYYDIADDGKTFRSFVRFASPFGAGPDTTPS